MKAAPHSSLAMDIASLVSDWGLLLTGISNAAVNILRVGMKQPFS